MKEIVLDTETTGLSVRDGHRIVEIGCIELEDLVYSKKKFHYSDDLETEKLSSGLFRRLTNPAI